MYKIKRSITFLIKICNQTEKWLLTLLFVSILTSAFSPLIISLFSKTIVDDIYYNIRAC